MEWDENVAVIHILTVRVIPRFPGEGEGGRGVGEEGCGLGKSKWGGGVGYG